MALNINTITPAILKAKEVATIDYVDTGVQSVQTNLNNYNPATVINNNTTTIDGGKITTGTLQADRLKAGINNSTVWTGGGLISSDFNGNAYGNIGTPTVGFRLSSNSAGTSADPSIYGAYIKGSFIESSTISTSTFKVATANSSNFGAVVNSQPLSGSFIGYNYGYGYASNRVCSSNSSISIVARGLTGTSSFVTLYLQYSPDNGTTWITIDSIGISFNVPLNLSGVISGSTISNATVILFRILNSTNSSGIAMLYNQ